MIDYEKLWNEYKIGLTVIIKDIEARDLDPERKRIAIGIIAELRSLMDSLEAVKMGLIQ